MNSSNNRRSSLGHPSSACTQTHTHAHQQHQIMSSVFCSFIMFFLPSLISPHTGQELALEDPVIWTISFWAHTLHSLTERREGAPFYLLLTSTVLAMLTRSRHSFTSNAVPSMTLHRQTVMCLLPSLRLLHSSLIAKAVTDSQKNCDNLPCKKGSWRQKSSDSKWLRNCCSHPAAHICHYTMLLFNFLAGERRQKSLKVVLVPLRNSPTHLNFFILLTPILCGSQNDSALLKTHTFSCFLGCGDINLWGPTFFLEEQVLTT